MATTITQLPSNYISIFPATRRAVEFQKDARHFNEANVINITNKMTDVDSYVITKTPSSSAPFEFVIHGYYVKVNSASSILAMFLASNPSQIYAYIEIDSGNDYKEIAGQDTTNSNGTTYYYGVKFTNVKPTGSNVYSLLILKKKNTSSALSIDNVQVPSTSIIKFEMESTSGLPDLKTTVVNHTANTTVHITADERKTWNAASQLSQINQTNLSNLTTQYNTHVNDNTRHITAAERTKWNEAYSSSMQNHKVSNYTLWSGNWSGSSMPFTYSLSVSGCTAELVPEIGSNIAANSSASAKNIKKNFSYLYRAETGAGKITFYAYKRPQVDIPITIKGA